jgi:hypothetical protein
MAFYIFFEEKRFLGKKVDKIIGRRFEGTREQS